MRLAVIIVAAFAAFMVFFLLPNPPEENVEHDEASCSLDDLGGIGDRIIQAPGACIQEIAAGTTGSEGQWKSGALTYKDGEWATGYEPTALFLADEYGARAISDGSSIPWTITIQDASGKPVFESSFTTGDYAVLKFDYQDLPGKDRIQVTRGGATHYEEEF